MIGLPELVTLITALFKFPKEFLTLMKILENTPQERHEALMIAMANEARAFEESGRPKWN